MGQARDQYLILSLPNSGTDWLCPILARQGGLRYYQKEFFNPICNPVHGTRLEAAFGCELASCYANIGLPWDRQVETLESLYRTTWAAEPYNFDKENFSPLKVAWFARHFRIVMLHRAASSVFPPSRLRVLAWYDAIYNAMADHGHLVRQAVDLTARAKRAHEVSWVLMRQAAACLDIPVLDYDELCTADRDRVRQSLAVGWIADVVNIAGAAADILATRRHTVKT